MIRNSPILEAFVQSQLRAPVDYAHNLQIVDALYAEAKALGVFPLSNPLDGIEVDVYLAKVINVHTPPRHARACSE